MGSSPKSVPPSRIRLLLLIKHKEGVVNKSYFDWKLWLTVRIRPFRVAQLDRAQCRLAYCFLPFFLTNKILRCRKYALLRVAGSIPAFGAIHCSSVGRAVSLWLCAYCPSPLRNKEDAVDQCYFARHAKTKRWLIVALLLKLKRCRKQMLHRLAHQSQAEGSWFKSTND